jgi:hypothetical protein
MYRGTQLAVSRRATKKAQRGSKDSPTRRIKESTANIELAIYARFARFFLDYSLGMYAGKCALKMYTGLRIDAVLRP